MKHLILIVFALSMLGLLLANEWFPLAPAVVQAECPNTQDLYCAPLWTPKMQEVKDVGNALRARIANHREGFDIAACGHDCAVAYDAAGKGILGSMAKVKGLDADAVAKAFMVEWDWRSTEARGKQSGWDAYQWLNDFAVKFRMNPPYRIYSDRVCTTQEYGGVCSGRY